MVHDKTSLFTYWAVISANFLVMNCASTLSWSSPSIPLLRRNNATINPLGYAISSSEESLIASLPAIGAVIGTILGGVTVEKLGRKGILILSCVCYIFCNLIIANAQNIYLLYLPRFVLGLATGAVLSVIPIYVGEISEDRNRGILGLIIAIMGSLGHLLTFGIGPLVSIKVFAYISILPAILFIICFVPFVPESPYYFISKNKVTLAEKSIKKIRSNESAKLELNNLLNIIQTNQTDKSSFKIIIYSATAKRSLLIGCGLLVFQPLLGITVVLLYLQPILDYSGTNIPVYFASLIIGIIQTLSVIVSAFLVDRLGRKILLYISAVGCAVFLLTLGVYFSLKNTNYQLESIFWVPVTSLALYFLFFNIGFGCVPWLVCSEIYANNIKSICVSISTCTNLILTFIIGFSVPYLRDAFGVSGVLYIFSIFSVISIVFVAFVVPETKGKSFQEIQFELCKIEKTIDSSLPGGFA